jgi:site-specific recombinase XerD
MPYNPWNEERALESAKRKIQALPVLDTNKKAILDFSESCFSEGLSIKRVIKYLYTLAILAKWLPMDFVQVSRQDVEKLVNQIERSHYAEWTKHDYRVALKKFFKWLRGTEDDYPPEVKWLRSSIRRHRTKLPDEILTQEEVQAMIIAATTVRDKALIASLYESGCRIGELLGLQIKQIQSHPHGLQVTVTGKTGARRLLLIASAPYLTDWLNQHPKNQEPQAPLWITDDYHAKCLTHARVSDILRRIAKRASIIKAVNPHNFRHSRATHLAMHLTEAQMNIYMGWVQGSDMPSTYVHLSGRDVDQALLKLNNISVADEQGATEKFSLRNCPRCSLSNPPANKFCSRCGMVLDEKTAHDLMKSTIEHSQADEIMDKLLQDSEFRSVLELKLRELTKRENRTAVSC